MKNIEIIINGLINQSEILIYNSNNRLIYKSRTNNGRVNVCLREKEIYKITICSKNMTKLFYLNSGCSFIMFYVNYCFNNNSENTRVRTFLLTDRNYKDLRIERGDIYL